MRFEADRSLEICIEPGISVSGDGEKLRHVEILLTIAWTIVHAPKGKIRRESKTDSNEFYVNLPIFR